MNRAIALVLLLATSLCFSGCEKKGGDEKGHRLVVVTTLFPLYDFARNVGGDRAQVTMLIPPGVEPHNFEPKPADAVRIAGADLLVYTSDRMEPWVKGIVEGVGAKSLSVVDASRGVTMQTSGDGDGDEHAGEHAGHQHGGADPHIWLDFANAQTMVATIAAEMARKDPAGTSYYQANARAYQEKLEKLDAQYREGLANCRTRVLLHGGHYAFGYLAKRYDLRYEAASAVNAEAEPTPAKIASLVEKMKKNGLRYVFSEELLSPRVSEIVARETGGSVLMLHGAHNIAKDDLNRGVTFLSLMEKNLQNLRTGLECK